VSATLSIATRAAAATLTMVFLSSKRVPRDLARGLKKPKTVDAD